MRIITLVWLQLMLIGQVVAAPIVVVISMDGVRWDYPDLGQLPNLERVISEGARAERLVPVYPSNTFPGHVSLATGAQPNRHGIVDNFFHDRERGRYFMSSDASWIQAEPVWITAERQDVKAATYFWVGSETDWRGQGTSYRMAPFDGQRPESEKVAKILEWLSLPETERPRLIMSYFAGVDSVAHREGPESPLVHEQLQRQDEQLGVLLAGIDERALWSRLTLIIVSDHGMTAQHKHVDLAERLADAGVAADVTGYTVGHVFLKDPGQQDTARAVLASVPGTRLLQAGEVTRQPYYFRQRAGDLVVLAEPPNIFSWPGGFEGTAMAVLAWFGREFGGHGYDPDLPDMGGIFLAMGRSVPVAKRLPPVRQIDVAPTVTALLGIDPPAQSEGTVVADLVVGE